MPELHLHLNYKLGRPSEPVAIETKLDWVIFVEKEIQKDTLSTVIPNKISVTFHDLIENVERFWKAEYFYLSMKESFLRYTNNMPMTCWKQLHKISATDMKLECYGNL